MARTVTASLLKAQGIPGQYQVAYTPTTNKLFITGTFNHSHDHGSSTATIARLEASTLQIEALAQLPVVPDTRPAAEGQYQIQGAYGLALDTERGTVWVGGTSTGSVTVYRQEDFTPVWNSLEAGVQGLHPREIYIDNPGNRAYITGMGGYHTIDLDTYEIHEHGSDQPGMHIPLGPIAHKAARELYLPEIISNSVWVIDLNTGVFKRAFEVPAADYKSLPPVVYGAELDPGRGELYISTQGAQGRNSGVHILDFNGELLDFIPYGKMPTDILYDAQRGLLYVTDFGAAHSPEPVGGTVGVIDVTQRKVLGQVRVAATKPNHQVLLPDGAVVVVDKAGEYKKVQVPFHIDPLTGTFAPAHTDEHPGEQPRPIDADSVVRFKVHTSGEPNTPTYPVFVPPQRVLIEDQGASVEVLAELPAGCPIEVTGAGWSKESEDDKQSGGSEVVIESDGVQLGHTEVHPSPFGALLTATVDFPSHWQVGQEYVITVRSGDAPGDVKRSLSLPVRIVVNEQERDDAAVRDLHVSAQRAEFAGYPELG